MSFLDRCLGVLLLVLFWQPSPMRAAPIVAKAGEIDISSWNYDHDGAMELSGDWRFYWKRFFTQDEIRQFKFLQEESLWVHAPGITWKDMQPPVESQGWATYILKVKGLAHQQEPLTVVMGQFMSTHETWLYLPKANQFLQLGKSGILSTTRQNFLPQYKRQSYELPEIKEDEVWLIVFHSSFWVEGVLGGSPTLIKTTVARQLSHDNGTEVYLIFGMFIMLMLTNLSLFLLRSEDKPSLLMTLVAGAMLLRYICTEGQLFVFFPEPNSWVSYAFLYVMSAVLPLGQCTYFEFLARSFPAFINRTYVNVCWAIALISIVACTLWQQYTQTIATTFWIPLSLLGCWILTGLIRAFRKGERSSIFALTGIALFILSITFDFMIYSHIIDFHYLGQYGMVLFTFMQSLVVGYNFGQAFRTAERLSHNLQQEVGIQTHKLLLQKEKLEEQKRELVAAHEGLREADEQKTRFFRSISHELRTPLSLILGSLPGAERPHTAQQSLDVVRRNASRLFRLVNQLLDFQKVALSKTRLRLEEIDLVHFVQGLAPYFVSASHEKGITFQVVVENSNQDTLKILAQADALEKIIFNYLANALKYTSKGGNITLRLSGGEGLARVTVIDDGPGIPEKEQDKLFKLFSQIEGSHQREQQGTGLGLALVKELAQHMHGQVGVKSQKNAGASFWVEFPTLTKHEYIDLLIVDRDAGAAEDILKPLQQNGWKGLVKTVKDGNEAIRILSSHRVHVFICATNLGTDMVRLLEMAARQTHCWKVLIAPKDKQKNELRSLHAESVNGWFERPLGTEFFQSLMDRLMQSQDPDRPILDLVYVEDEPLMQEDFLSAISKYTLLESVRLVSRGEELRRLIHEYRVRVVVADAGLEGERGTDLLAFVSRVSPDTFRILLTGETSQDILGAGITDAHVHYIIYKPANLEQETKVLESYVSRSPIQPELARDPEQENNKEWHLAGLEPGAVLDQKLGVMVPEPGNVKATILVVDDVGDMRSMIGSILLSHEFHVLFASNGLQALEMLQNRVQTIDIIVTDWLMPQLNGPDMIAQLRNFEDLASIPTILLTAKTDAESKAYGTQIGASAYIGKPFDERELLSTIENLLDLKKRERKIEELNRFIATNVLQRFLPPDLVEDLVAGKAKFDDAAQLRTITVLFADLCGFTQSTEKQGPERIARILNAFLVRMTDVIFSQGGTIDKFMGDGILVMFGAPRAMEPPLQAQAAARCACLMQHALTDLNRDWWEEEGVRFQMRIGIHHGQAIVGSFGGERRSDYTAVGNTVNIASRVETCAEPGEVLVTPSVIDFLEAQQFETAGSFKLKGIEGEMILFRLLDEDATGQGAA